MIEQATLVRLCRARDRLCESAERSLTVREIAGEARLSPFHFIRLFATVFGETPHQQRIHHRLERARQLLARGEQSVTEVCVEVGFSSLGSFSDLFRRRIGVAPSQYRREARALVQVPGRAPQILNPPCLLLMCGPAGIAIFEKQAAGRR